MRPFHRQAWCIYMCAALVAIVIYPVLPGGWFGVGAFDVIGWSACAAIAFGIRLHRPVKWLPWALIAAGLFMNVAGNLVEAIVTNVFNADGTPSPADAFYLCLYPGLVSGLFLVLRRRSPSGGRANLLDAAVVSAGLALLVWVFIMQPLAADGSSHLLLRVVSVSYPIGDVLVFSLLAALMFGRSTRNSADYLMAASLLAFLVGDFSWAVFNQVNFNPNWLVADALQAVFLFALAAMGAAGLHPAMKGIDLPVGTAPDRLTRKRLTAMCVATMVAPGILALESLRGRVIDGTAVAAGSVVLFVLVIARLAEVVRRVEAQSRRLEELVTVDTLTGVANRRALETELPGFMADSDRTGDHLCLAVLDIDHFKTFNDEYGHQAGDRLLKATVEAWQRELRARDCLIRYGGDEFLVVLPRTGKADASSVLERLRVGMPLGQTLSGGLAEWDGSETPDQLLRRADDALYAAKRAGRKRVEVAPGGRVVGPVGLAQAG